MRHIFLYGPPASGKTTVGKFLAEELKITFLDLDELITKVSGMDITQIIAERGESFFREVESTEFERLRLDTDSVVALGGGTLLHRENRARAESIGEIICLDAATETLLQHLKGEYHSRPLLAGDSPKKLAALLRSRAAHYASFPRHVNVDGKSVEQIVLEIQIMIGRFYLRGMNAGYSAEVQAGGLDSLGMLIQTRGLQNPIIVTDENVAKLHIAKTQDSLLRSNYTSRVISIPAGESGKTMETVARLWRSFLEGGLDRKSTVVALGGGVICDLAGFAAATFMRGVDWVVVPTTLLSMVDASLGGKTGFDLPEGKNLIGCFHAPRLVLADPDLLSTLPEVELRSGLAEVVKHAIIADPILFGLCESGMDNALIDLPQLVRRAMAVKIKIIEDDPYEKGFRAALNFGHTVGHAVESVSGYCLRHGEAVAIGMVAETKLAEYLDLANKGLSTRIAEVLLRLGLPTQIPNDLSKESLIRTMQFDKKRSSGALRFALPLEIGKVKVNVEVQDLELLFREI